MAISDLLSQCLNCTRCDLCKTRTTVVFGVGDENADIMFVGEGPGHSEDIAGVPFVGRGGELFNCYLDAVGLKRRDVYIANIVKCRPPENRDPSPEEQEACIGWLRGQFEVVEPKIIVCLGRIAAKKLIKDDFRVTAEHGQVFSKNGVLMMGTFHPAALLRNPANKGTALDDFKKLRELSLNNFKQGE